MSADQYVLWFIGMAVGLVLLLGLGTLTMADLLHRPVRRRKVEPPVAEQEAEDDHHHWYDRFHHAA